MATGWGGGRLLVPPHRPRRLLLRRRPALAGRRRWACALGTSGVWRSEGCGGSFHPGAPTATGEAAPGPGWRGGGGGGVEAGGGRVGRGGRADAWLVGWRW